MPESSVVVRPEPMHSATYTPSSRLRAAGLAEAIAVFERAAEQLHRLNATSPFRIEKAHS